jgi:hypothetical protein
MVYTVFRDTGEDVTIIYKTLIITIYTCKNYY